MILFISLDYSSIKTQSREADRDIFFMALTEELPIYRATYWLLNLLIRATQEFPLFYKYSLGTRMVDICLDMSMLLYLLHETIFNCPEKNCILRCPVSHWKGLPG